MMLSCANEISSRSNNILSRRNKLKNNTRMSLPGFRTNLFPDCFIGNNSLSLKRDNVKDVEDPAKNTFRYFLQRFWSVPLFYEQV